MPQDTTIFVGAASQMEQLLAPAISDPMLATGNVGLYGHLSGVYDMVLDGDMQALSRLWSAAAPGVEENGVNTVVAKQLVTIKNTTAAPIDVPVGTIVATADGAAFTVLMTRRPSAGWVTGGTLGDGSWGHYVIAPGASIQVSVEATEDGPSGNVLANAITNIEGVAGAVITASVASAVALQIGAGTVTLRNTTTSDVVITSSDLVQGTAGTGQAGQYQVGRDPTEAGYQALNADGSSWQYVLKAGSQITVPVYSVAPAYSASTDNGIIQAILAENAPAGSILGGVNLPSGVVVTGSGAITSAGVTSPSDAATFGILGPGTSNYTDRVQQWLTTQQGFLPSEANVNVDYTQLWTPLDLANWKSQVDALRSQGVMNVAPVWSDNELSDVATSDAFANIRAAALYGGGLSVDAPPEFVYNLAQSDSAYIPALEALFRWCTANGLRSSMILSPNGGAGNDPNLLANTQKLVAQLRAAGAMPSQFIMENYSQVPAAAGDYFSQSADSLNAVSTWLATVPMTSTASESNLEVAGQAAADHIMTGLRPDETVAGDVLLQPYDELQVFAASALTVMTATVTCASPELGRLQAIAGGTVSGDGAAATVSGTADAVEGELRGIRFQAATGAAGTETLTLRILDAAGPIEGATILSVDNPAQQSAATSQLIALAASDSVYAAQNGDTVACGSGAATVSASSGSVLVHAAAGPLLFIGGSGSATVIGGSGGGVFTGGAAGHNVLVAGGGNTTLTGGGGGDALFGSADGNDVMRAGPGRESLIGGGGNTTITGGATAGAVIFTGGNTTVTGGAAGGDTVVGGAGSLMMSSHDDAVFAGSGAATVTGGTSGADSIIGGSDSLDVTGHGDNMIVVGGEGACRIDAGDGANLIFCGSGSMSLAEGSGPATVVPGHGSASIEVGAGAMVIDVVRGAAGGAETIQGFRPGTDQIALFGYGAEAASVRVSAGGSVLSLSDGTSITLLGVVDPGRLLAA